MKLKRRISDDWTFQKHFTQEDVSIVAFACQLLMEDAEIEDTDGFLASKHMQEIEKMFPTVTGIRTTKVYKIAGELVEQFEGEF
jgi:hypothetical protein